MVVLLLSIEGVPKLIGSGGRSGLRLAGDRKLDRGSEEDCLAEKVVERDNDVVLRPSPSRKDQESGTTIKT
jgi:hypothetical protein